MRPLRIAALLVPILASSIALPRVALAAHPAAWADSAGAWPAAADAHRPGRWSLDFAIGQDFTLVSFKGSTISATHATSPTSAWRFGLGYALSTDRTGSGGGLSFTDSTVTAIAGTDRENEQVQLSAVAMRLHRFRPARRVGAYVAVGPEVSWSRMHSEQTRAFSPVTATVVNNYFHQVSVGLDGEIGAEAMAARDVGLFAQYGSRGGYSWSRQTLRGQVFGSSGNPLGPAAEVVQRERGWFLNPGGVRFGVSLYL